MKLIERAREFLPLKRFYLFGMAGSIVVLACILVPMAAYVGGAGERYSPLNHFISELGQVGVSRLAPVFNAGLIAAGVLYVPFVLGLGAAVGGWWAAAGTLAGLVSAVSVACVGVFPMNNLAPHITAAMTFFRSGLVTVLLFGFAIQLPARRPAGDRPPVQHRGHRGPGRLRRLHRVDRAAAGRIRRLPPVGVREPAGRVDERHPRVAGPRRGDRVVLRGRCVPEEGGRAGGIAFSFPSAPDRRRSSHARGRCGSRAGRSRTGRPRAP